MELVVKCPSSLPFLSSFLLIIFSHGYVSQFFFFWGGGIYIILDWMMNIWNLMLLSCCFAVFCFVNKRLSDFVLGGLEAFKYFVD